jgi:hypothetical protein
VPWTVIVYVPAGVPGEVLMLNLDDIESPERTVTNGADQAAVAPGIRDMFGTAGDIAPAKREMLLNLTRNFASSPRATVWLTWSIDALKSPLSDTRSRS